MAGLRADVARLALRVLGAFFNREHDALLVFLVGVVLFRAATFPYLFTQLVVALLPMLFLALGTAVARLAAAALLGEHGRQRGSASWAVREDHRVFMSVL
jgi:hypothetical protein